MQKKIVVAKTDTTEAIVEKILSSDADEITLVVSRQSKVGDAVSTLRLIKREADARGKVVSVESVDENILAFAEAAGMNAVHPLLVQEVQSPSVADIVLVSSRNTPPRTESEGSEPARAARPSRKIRAGRKIEISSKPILNETHEEISDEEHIVDEPLPRAHRARRSRGGMRILVRAIVLALVIVAGGWVFGALWGTGKVAIHFKKIPIVYDGMLSVRTAASKLDTVKNILPGEVFNDVRNITQLFPASGVSAATDKATGKITIYNAYSSAPQSLVATTRFMAPDGKIVRLVDKVMVPGANVSGGKITPAKIEAPVVADKAGPDYNIGPIAKLTIPGFKGTPKYDGFYGVIESPLSGGASGMHKIATDDDVLKAKSKTTEILKSSLSNNFLARRPEGIVIPDGASDIAVTKLTVKTATDTAGNFSVFGEASFRAIGFREADLRALLFASTGNAGKDLIFKNVKMEYRNVHPDFVKKELTLSVRTEGTATEAFSSEEFVNTIKGVSIDEARNIILSLPGIADATVSLWPQWLTKFPGDPKRIELTTD